MNLTGEEKMTTTNKLVFNSHSQYVYSPEVI